MKIVNAAYAVCAGLAFLIAIIAVANGLWLQAVSAAVVGVIATFDLVDSR